MTAPDQPKKILVVSDEGVGHVHSCVGLTIPLLHRGHRVAFLTERTFAGKLKSHGFEEIVYETFYDHPEQKQDDQLKPGQLLAENLINNRIIQQPDTLESLKNLVDFFFRSDHTIGFHRHWNKAVQKALDEFQPDLLIMDAAYLLPAIRNSGLPVIYNYSLVPTLGFHCAVNMGDVLPPGGSGLSIDSDKVLWQPYREVLKKLWFNQRYNDFIEESGYERYPDDCVCPQIQQLTIYGIPEEYNYPPLRDLKDWFNIEVYNKNLNQEMVDLKELVPTEFYDDDLDGRFTGKWIYVSMGSMCSADLDLMHRLVEALSKTNHKYIVSKGPRHQEYRLERNMWGDRFLPQTKLLPLMDLVLTHGGNNSVTETFAQGKPMIVLPLFGDQPDNAQRLHETGYGIRLDPYLFTERELNESIERLLNDDDLKQRLANASQRIRSTNTHEQFADRVDQILLNNVDDQPK